MTLSTVSRLIVCGIPLLSEEMSVLCGLAMWAGMLEAERDTVAVAARALLDELYMFNDGCGCCSSRAADYLPEAKTLRALVGDEP